MQSVEQMKLDDGTSGGSQELITVMAKNLDLAYCKIVEVVAETIAPLNPTEELLAKISSQIPYISSPKKPDVVAVSDPAPSEPAIAIATEKETAQPKPVAKQSLLPYIVSWMTVCVIRWTNCARCPFKIWHTCKEKGIQVKSSNSSAVPLPPSPPPSSISSDEDYDDDGDEDDTEDYS
ncbi:hypothetical protein Ahy_A08g037839 [Arachis hypogaea]|uniref:Uncharacterized protein n=1 Tax=Arachis hypogaea TaxID=3818 RepID=A0A445BRX9_ARAHY|nr:hypothetical protein Ahy_A08g037839 [Arachis hypogaea]